MDIINVLEELVLERKPEVNPFEETKTCLFEELYIFGGARV